MVIAFISVLLVSFINAQNVVVPDHNIQVWVGKHSYWAKAGKPVVYASSNKKMAISFYPTTKIQVWAGKHTYWAQVGQKVEFHQNGNVKSFVPTSNVQVFYRNGTYKWKNAGQRIEFDQNGYAIN